MSRTLLLLIGLMVNPVTSSFAGATAPSSPSPVELPVFVTETTDKVLLRIPVAVAVDPDTVEVRLAGRAVSVVARERDGGRRVRSREITLQGHAVESGAEASYDDGWLTVEIHKRGRHAPER